MLFYVACYYPPTSQSLITRNHSQLQVTLWKDSYSRLAGACCVMIKTRSARIASISLTFKYRCTLDCIDTVKVRRLIFKCSRALHSFNMATIHEHSTSVSRCAFNNYPCALDGIHPAPVNRLIHRYPCALHCETITTIHVPSPDVSHCAHNKPF